MEDMMTAERLARTRTFVRYPCANDDPSLPKKVRIESIRNYDQVWLGPCPRQSFAIGLRAYDSVIKFIFDGTQRVTDCAE